MKIAFISLEYPPAMIGGAGVYLAQIAPRLAQLGHEIHIITPNADAAYHYAREAGVHIHRLPTKSGQRVLAFWALLPKFFRLIEHSVAGFDLIHGNGISDVTLGRTRSTQRRIVTVHHLASSALRVLQPSLWSRLRHPGAESGIVPLIEAIPLRRAQHIVAVSAYTKKDLVATFGLAPETISVIRHGASPEAYRFAPEELAMERAEFDLASRPLLLSVGRLEARKGIEVLMEALSTSLLKGAVVLALVGAGAQERYKTLAHRLGIAEQVRFCGRVDEDRLRRLYAACDLFVFPSLLEGLGIAVLEARAAGKFVIASEVGGIPEIVPPTAGRLVPPGQALPLAQALHDALARPLAQVPAVESWDVAAQQLVACYQRTYTSPAATQR